MQDHESKTNNTKKLLRKIAPFLLLLIAYEYACSTFSETSSTSPINTTTSIKVLNNEALSQELVEHEVIDVMVSLSFEVDLGNEVNRLIKRVLRRTN
jgi:hypothetical protein